MKLEGNEVEIGSYLVILSTGCFYDQHPELPYFGRTMPPLGVPLRVASKRMFGRVAILSFRDDEGIYHGAFEVGHCGHPLSFYYRWPTTRELCKKFSGGSFDLNDSILRGSFDFNDSVVWPRRHYYYNPNTDQPKSLGATNTIGKYFVGCDPYQESPSLKSPEVVPVKYKIGDRFTHQFMLRDKEYILAQVGSGIICMVGLSSGNCYSDPVKVSDVYNILPSEIPDLNPFTPKK